jgi:hypothetical protein
MMDIEYYRTLERIKNFVSGKLGIDKSLLTESIKIEDDVGIGDLDTYTFYENFFDEFEIVNPDEFDINKYVTPDNQIVNLIKGIFSKRHREKLNVKTTTLKHLTEVAMAKKWFEPR